MNFVENCVIKTACIDIDIGKYDTIYFSLNNNLLLIINNQKKTKKILLIN